MTDLLKTVSDQLSLLCHGHQIFCDHVSMLGEARHSNIKEILLFIFLIL